MITEPPNFHETDSLIVIEKYDSGAIGSAKPGHQSPGSGAPRGGAAQNGYANDPALAEMPGYRPGHNLRTVLGVLFGRKKLALSVAAFILLITAAAVVLLPSNYTSEAKLLVRLGRESVDLDPTARVGQAAVPMEGRDKEINSEIELLKSRKLVDSVVQSIGANRILGRSTEQAPDANAVAAATVRLEDKFIIEAIPDSNVLSVQFSAHDPELSRDVIAQLIDAYLDQRLGIYEERGDLQFFQAQLDKARQNQTQIQQQLQALRDSSGVSDVSQQRQALVQRINDLDKDIDTYEATIRARSDSLNAATAEFGRMTVREQRQADFADDAMLTSMVESLKTQKAAAVSQLQWVNQVDVKTQALQQQATLADATVTQYAQAFEQARIDQEMNKNRLSNISIAEPPVYPVSPTGPNRALLALAGIFLAGVMGMGSAFVAEGMDHTVRRSDDLRALGLEFNISAPHVPAELVIANEAEAGRVFVEQPLFPEPRAGSSGAPFVPLRAAARGNVMPGPAARIGVAPDNAALPDDSAPRNRAIGGPVSPSITGITAGKPAKNLPQLPPFLAGLPIFPVRPAAVSPSVLTAMHGLVERLIAVSANGESIGNAPPRFIGVVGASRDQGASTIALHLAISLTQRFDQAAGVVGPERVLIFDADLERSGVSALAGVQAERMALGDSFAMENVQNSGVFGRKRFNRLDVLTASLLQESSIGAERMPTLLQDLGRQYRHVIVDLPSVLESESSARLAGLIAATVLVCKSGDLRIEVAGRAVARLREVGANVAVTVLNQRRYPVPDWIYHRT